MKLYNQHYAIPIRSICLLEDRSGDSSNNQTNARIVRSLSIVMVGLFLITSWLISGPAYAANECHVKYFWVNNNGNSQEITEYIDVGQTLNINQNGAVKVDNKNGNSIRVYRTGIGQYVDLNPNTSDPSIGSYPPYTTLQQISCLQSADPAPTQQVVNALFSAVSQFTSDVLNQLNTWKNDASVVANKAIEDWGSCPSPGAQTAYNQINSHRDAVQAALNGANAMKTQAEDAFNTCKQTFNNSPMCNASYNTLPLHAQIISLETAKTALNGALESLRSLKCINGCNQSASLNVPAPTWQDQGFWSLRNPGWIRGRVCTRVDFGSIEVNTGAISSGNLNQTIQTELPRCSRTQPFAICTNWDLVKLLALLQKLEIVPPDVGRIEVNVPNQTVRVPTGLGTTQCQNAIKVCVPSGNVKISVNEGVPLFDGTYNSCASQQTIACQEPPFGLRVNTSRVEIPDVTKTVISWTGRKPGSIILDLSARDFQDICLGRGRTALRIPRLPRIGITQTQVNLPFLCTQPNWVNVVANP